MHKLREFLESSEMTQATLATAIGVSQPTVSDWINGHMQPSVANLIVIARVTGLSVDELLTSCETA